MLYDRKSLRNSSFSIHFKRIHVCTPRAVQSFALKRYLWRAVPYSYYCNPQHIHPGFSCWNRPPPPRAPPPPHQWCSPPVDFNQISPPQPPIEARKQTNFGPECRLPCSYSRPFVLPPPPADPAPQPRPKPHLQFPHKACLWGFSVSFFPFEPESGRRTRGEEKGEGDGGAGGRGAGRLFGNTDSQIH